MYTDCPNCHTYFKITPMQLKAAEGKVRCGSCNHVFNALTNLVEKVPPVSSRIPASKASEAVESSVSAVVEEPVRTSRVSSPANSESIDLADTLSLSGVSDLDSLNDSFISAESQSPNALDDINKDIDDALNDLFDDESEMVKPLGRDSKAKARQSGGGGQQRIPEEPKIVKRKKKNEVVTPEPEVSELDLDGFDDLLFEASDDSDSPLEAMSEEGDSFMSNEPLERHEVEWETLSRPAKPPSPPKPSKLEAMKNKIEEGFNVSRAMWIVIICVLTIVLLGQFAYSKHEELVKYSPIKAVMEQACAVIDLFVDCTVPPPRDVEAFVIMNRNVVGHPNAENALLITATISNDAEFNQQFPELVLTFLDINQQILARRAFKSEEYVSDDMDIRLGMEPKEPVKIVLEIVDPGEAAVNFEFDFR